MPSWLLSDWAIWTLSVLGGIVGLAMALRGIIGDRARGRPHCWKCRYDMSGGESLTCSECGHVHRDRKRLFKTKRYYFRFAFGAALVMLALHCHTGPEVQYRRSELKEKWHESIVPTTVWIALLPQLNDDHVLLLEKRINPPDHRYDPFVIDTPEWERAHDPARGVNLPIIHHLADWQCRLLRWSAETYIEQTRTTAKSCGYDDWQERLADSTVPRSRVHLLLIAVRHKTDIVPALLQQMNDPSPAIRVRAALALVDDLTRADEVLPTLIEATNDPDLAVRLSACRSIHWLGPRAMAAVPALLAVVENPENAESAVYEAGYEPLGKVSGRSCVRDYAARVVVDLDPDTYPQVVRLTAKSVIAHKLAKENKTKEEENEKAEKIRMYPLTWAQTVDACLADPREFVTLGRMNLLPEDSPPWRTAAEKLLRALNGENREVRRAARYMFIDMGRDAAPLIEWACAQDNGDLHEIVQELVINLGPDGADLVPKLGRAMFRDPKRFTGMFVEMLSSVGTLTPELLDFLIVSSGDKDAAVRTMVHQTLDVLRPDETALTNRVHNLLKTDDVGVRINVVRALPALPVAAETRDKMLAWIAKYDQSAEVRDAARAASKDR